MKPQARLIQLARSMRVDLVMTPRAKLLCVQEGRTVPPVPEGFDFLPLLKEERVKGLLRREVALRATGAARFPEFEAADFVDATCPLGDVPAKMGALGVLLVGEPDNLTGLVHISDFNRHAFRAYLYLRVSTLEIALAAIIERVFRDEEPRRGGWMALLSESRQIELKRSLEGQRRENLDLEPIEAVSLVDLLTVARRHAGMRRGLGFTSGREAKDTLGCINELRKPAMHSVKRVVRDLAGATDLGRRLVRLDRLLEHALKMLRDLDPQGEGALSLRQDWQPWDFWWNRR